MQVSHDAKTSVHGRGEIRRRPEVGTRQKSREGLAKKIHEAVRKIRPSRGPHRKAPACSQSWCAFGSSPSASYPVLCRWLVLAETRGSMAVSGPAVVLLVLHGQITMQLGCLGGFR